MTRPSNAELLTEVLRTLAFVNARRQPVSLHEVEVLNGWTTRQLRDGRLARCLEVLVEQEGLLEFDPDGNLVVGLPVRWASLTGAADAITMLLLCDLALVLPGLDSERPVLSELRTRLSRLLALEVAAEFDTPAAVRTLTDAASSHTAVRFRYRAADDDVRSFKVVASEPVFAAGEWRFAARFSSSEEAYTLRVDRIIGEVEPIGGEARAKSSLKRAESTQHKSRSHVRVLCHRDDVAALQRFGAQVSTAGSRRRVDLELYPPLEELFALLVQGCAHQVDVIDQPGGVSLDEVQQHRARLILEDYSDRDQR